MAILVSTINGFIKVIPDSLYYLTLHCTM